jgi:hypothetical protein
MKLKISAAKFNNRGVSLSIENSEGDSLVIYETTRHQDLAAAAEIVEKELHLLIKRFNHLPLCHEPFSENTQNAVNRL